MEPDVIEQTTLPEPTLREELAKNLADAAPVETTPQAQPADVLRETPEVKAGRLANRVRDESGKLLPGKAEPKAPEPAAQMQQPVMGAPKRPSSWKKDYWQDFDKIAAENPKLAAYLNERESQFASGVSTYKQEWEQAKPLIDAIAPFQPILQQNGIDPAQWVRNLGNAHQRLAMGSPQDKVAMFQKLVSDYQVPVQLAVQGQDGNWQLLGQQPPQQQYQQPQFNPSVIPQMVRQTLLEESTKQTLESFEREAPAKYPHYEAVKQTMAGLLQAGLADDLPSAYEAALRHPRHADLFQELQQQQQEQQAAEAQAAKQAKVQRARSNAVSTRSATPGAQMTQAGEKGLRDEIAANLAAISGGRV